MQAYLSLSLACFLKESFEIINNIIVYQYGFHATSYKSAPTLYSSKQRVLWKIQLEVSEIEPSTFHSSGYLSYHQNGV